MSDLPMHFIPWQVKKRHSQTYKNKINYSNVRHDSGKKAPASIYLKKKN